MLARTEETMNFKYKTVDQLEELPEGTIIKLARGAGLHDVYIKNSDAGWEQNPGERLRWWSVGSDGVPESSDRVVRQDIKGVGHVYVGTVDVT